MVVTVFLLDKDFEIQAVLDNKISWEYTKAVNKATEISVALPREDFAATSKSNLTKIAQYIQIYSDGLYTIGGKVIKRDITDNTVTLMALTEECKMESVLCPAQYGRKYEDYDLADVVRDLNKGWYTQRIKSNTQWDTSIDSSNIDSSSMTNAILLTKGSNGIYNSDGYATYRFNSSDVANFSSWDRIRWLSDNHAQTDEGVIELISTTVQYRYGATAATMGGWSAPIVGALPDTLGLSIETITDAIVDVRINLHTDDLTSEGPEGDIIGTTPVVFALEVIARTEAYIGTTHIPANAGVLVKSLDADGTSAFELLTASCEMVGWEFEVYDNQIYIAETLGHDLTESFVFRKEENIRITELSDSDEELVNVLIANGTGSGINRPSITLRDDASIAEYGEYPMIQEFDTEVISELTTMAQDYLDEHKAIEFNWRVDTFDSIDSTVTGDIVFEEAIAFHRLYSNSAFTVPSSNRAEQNLFFYNPLYTAGDTIRIIDPLQGTLIDSRILEERRTGDETGIHVSLYLNKARNVLVSRVARPAKINPLSAPYTIIAKPIVNGVVLTVSSSSERHRWADTQIFMSETSPVVCDVPVITGRTGTFTITELSPDKRYYFVAKYVDNNRDVSAQSNEVSCQPLIMGDLTELLIQANTTVINITARNVLQTPTITFKIKNVVIPIGNVTVARSDGGSLTQIDSTTYSMDCSTVSVPSISVTADATYDGKDYTSSVVIVVEKALLAPVDNFAGVTLIPEEALDGGDLLKGDYFLWTGVTTATHPKVEHEVDEDALVYGEIYEYERTSPGMWQKSINGDLVMTLFDSFAKLDVDVTSTVIGNAVIKRLVAIDAFIQNLQAENLKVGTGTGLAGSGFRFRAVSDMNENGTNVPMIDVTDGEDTIFQINPASKNITIGDYTSGNGMLWDNTAKKLFIRGQVNAESGVFTGQLDTITIETFLDDGTAIDIGDITTIGSLFSTMVGYFPIATDGDITGTINGDAFSSARYTSMTGTNARDWEDVAIWFPTSYQFYEVYSSALIITCDIIFNMDNGTTKTYTIRKIKNNSVMNNSTGVHYPPYPTMPSSIQAFLALPDFATPYSQEAPLGGNWTWPPASVYDGTGKAQSFPYTVKDVLVVNSTQERLYLDNLPTVGSSETNRVWRDYNGFLRIGVQ